MNQKIEVTSEHGSEKREGSMLSNRNLCIVHDMPATFLTWEQYATTIPESLTIGGPPAGQFACLYGIIEFADGIVSRVDPEDIQFVKSDKNSDFV